MLTLASDLRWTETLAFVAASILGVALLIGVFCAWRYRLSQRRKRSSAPIDFDDPLIYPRETPFTLVSFLVFNLLVVSLAFYVPWPFWLRLLIAFPFILMGAFCCFVASVFIGDWARARRESRPQHKGPELDNGQ